MTWTTLNNFKRIKILDPVTISNIYNLLPLLWLFSPSMCTHPQHVINKITKTNKKRFLQLTLSLKDFNPSRDEGENNG